MKTRASGAISPPCGTHRYVLSPWLIACALASLAPDALPWEIAQVGDGLPGETLSCVDLVLDSGDVPHICYGGEMLRYATRTAEGWHVEVLDSTLAITGAALGLMTDGSPVAAWSGASAPLACAWRDQSGWRTEGIDEVYGSHFLCVDVDSLGQVHLCYHDPAANCLRYAVRAGTEWRTETVDGAGSVGWGCALDLDSLGRPHISYADYGNGDLRYATLGTEGWQVEVVDDDREVGWETSLRVDGGGEPHVVYYDSASRFLRYARRGADGWEILPVVPPYPTDGLWGSLALDCGDNPHIAFVTGVDGTLSYMWLAESWVLQAVVNSVRDGVLALDGEGNPHLAYLWNGGPNPAVCLAVGQAGLSVEPPLPSDRGLIALTVAPNPCAGHAVISYRTPVGPAELAIFDMVGREVERKLVARVDQAITWQPSFPPGAYVVALLSGGSIRGASRVTVVP